MEDGRWKMEDGRWKMEVRQLIGLLSMLLIAFDSLALEKVTMQLRWHHQFQFAGYYAAQHKGFYKDAGFDVEIRAGSPNRQPVTEVLSGRADFAEGNSEVLLRRLQGEPLVALAAIFQHSPSVLLTLEKNNLTTPESLSGKRIMMIKDGEDIDLYSMFRQPGAEVSGLKILDSSYNIDDLISGKVSAFNSYLTNEPYYLEQKNIPYSIINPRDYGIDFYSDILFTSESMVKEDPFKVERFRLATLQGWEYALRRPEEIIKLIGNIYGSKKDTNHLRYEANAVRQLVMPELLPIGHIHQDRFLRMAKILFNQGVVDDLIFLENFVFKAPDEIDNKVIITVVMSIVGVLLAFLLSLNFIRLNKNLRKEIVMRKCAELKLKSLAETDELTGLSNRRVFTNALLDENANARRHKTDFSVVLMDVDNFKNFNDVYGHVNGDKALCTLANTIKYISRPIDVCARYGGEEFILLLSCVDKVQVLKLAEQIRQAIAAEKIQLINNEIVSITVSVGVAMWSEVNGGDLVNCADEALYQAKRKGKNCVEVYASKTKHNSIPVMDSGNTTDNISD